MTLKFVLRSQKRTSVLVTDVGDKNVADNDDDSSVNMMLATSGEM